MLSETGEPTWIEKNYHTYYVDGARISKMEPQPNEDDIIRQIRVNRKYKADRKYEGRITWFESNKEETLGNIAIWEYSGINPIDKT